MKVSGVTSIGIIGAGMIGQSMAVLTTGHGYKTVCLVRRAEKIPGCRQGVLDCFQQIIDQGLMKPGQGEICGRYLTYTTDYGQLADCEVIFECIAEDLAQKQEVYRQIEAHCPRVRAICSVSSAIVADQLCAASGPYADRILVTHPFNPAHMVPYFEVCGGSRTDPKVLEFVRALLISLDRKPVLLKKPTPGFIGNRLQFALWREALHLVEEGVADPEDIDTCLRYSFCPRYTSIGIFEHFDNGGLLLNETGCNNIFPHLSNAAGAPPAVTERIARGELGQKTGVGFYDWRGVDMQEYYRRVNAPYWQFLNWDVPQE